MTDWNEVFEGKEESELPTRWPDGLTTQEIMQWRMARNRAILQAIRRKEYAMAKAQRAKDDQEAAARAEENADINANQPAGPGGLAEAPVRAYAAVVAPAAAPAIAAPQPLLELPQGTAAQLLEAQLAASAALITDLANYVARGDVYPEVCTSFMDRMTAMLGASANIGKVVGRLRGEVSRTQQDIFVNHRGGERGEGGV